MPGKNLYFYQEYSVVRRKDAVLKNRFLNFVQIQEKPFCRRVQYYVEGSFARFVFLEWVEDFSMNEAKKSINYHCI